MESPTVRTGSKKWPPMVVRFRTRVVRALGWFLVGTLFVSAPRAQKLLDKSLPANHAKNDPYTRGEPELMKAAGILSHGGFEFAESDTATVEKYLGTLDIRWLETEHFELGFALGPYKVPQKEKKFIRATLLRLQERLPDVNEKAKILDPWLRAHIYAMRLEDMYAQFLELIQVDQSVFPDGSKPWNRTGTYRGEGPHLGQKGKYEVFLLPNESVSVQFLNKNFGLQTKRSQRWNVVSRETLTLTVHTQQGSLKAEPALSGHVAFNMIQNLLDGLEHYSYDSPIWLKEGLAHWAERRVTTNFNTFDGAEGSMPETSRKSNWRAETKKIVQGKEASRMASLIRKNGYGELSLDDHFTVWSMIDFLHTTRPEKLAKFLQALKGRMDEEGYADSSDLPSYHREIFKEHLGMSYSEFDTAWSEWVLMTY